MALAAPGSEWPDVLARMEWQAARCEPEQCRGFEDSWGGAQAMNGSASPYFLCQTEGATRWIRSRTM
jgi:hypothetical protein